MDREATSLGERALIAYARLFPLRLGKLRLVNALWQVAAGRRGPLRTARLEHAGYSVPCDLRDMLQRQFYFFGTYFLEDAILRCWSREARGAAVIFDVGANAGIYSLAAVAANPTAAVHAFEPTPEIAQGLRATAKLNGLDQVHVHELAIFSSETEVALRRWRGESGDNEGMNFVTEDTSAPEAEIVRGVSIDGFCRDRGIEAIDLIKIDIQGHEAAALRGARDMLAEGRIGTIFMELNWSHDDDVACPATEAVSALETAGYRFSAPGERLVWRPAGPWMRSISDVVASRQLIPRGSAS